MLQLLAIEISDKIDTLLGWIQSGWKLLKFKVMVNIFSKTAKITILG